MGALLLSDQAVFAVFFVHQAGVEGDLDHEDRQ
jgi:hypothetical protein